MKEEIEFLLAYVERFGDSTWGAKARILRENLVDPAPGNTDPNANGVPQ
ncbi:hypothetical protein UFOVP130_33 [uncultured Caudovirales phage]|uniref:Uncharacterized protein n=1 Tax=uncultured Caudovirales phage TaxID=2100421 RepID=A0A6J5LCC0_9CAUD|nr:hypothetical protein UFOVP130_33 [uncultured Caudovirales phage]